MREWQDKRKPKASDRKKRVSWEDKYIDGIKRLPSLSAYNAKDLVEHAKAIAGNTKDIKTAQIRKIYGTVKNLEQDVRLKKDVFDKDKIILLKPKFAYAANKKAEVRPLQRILDVCIDKVHEVDDFKTFVNFFEAILAYHRG